MNRRQWLGRLRAGRCPRHDKPVVQAVDFDGGTCSLGCRVGNTLRFWALGMTRRERRDWIYDHR